MRLLQPCSFLFFSFFFFFVHPFRYSRIRVIRYDVHYRTGYLPTHYEGAYFIGRPGAGRVGRDGRFTPAQQCSFVAYLSVYICIRTVYSRERALCYTHKTNTV